MKFSQAVEIVLHHEGGYVYNDKDPGGETNFGISKRAYPLLDIKNLTKKEAVDIYKLHYWDAVKADILPAKLRLIVFDCAVNQGVSRAVRFLQSCVNVDVDGVLGDETLLEVTRFEESWLLNLYAEKRHDHYVRLSTWKNFGAGWSKRLLDVALKSALYS